MSQEFGGGDDLRTQFKRRSSIVQQAKKDGIIPEIGDILWGLGGEGLPSSRQPSLSSRTSNLSVRSNTGGGTGSLIPTPVSRSRQPPGRGGAGGLASSARKGNTGAAPMGRGGVSIGVSSSVPRSRQGTASSASKSKERYGSASARGGVVKRPAQRPSAQNPIYVNSNNNMTLGTLRRSNSYDAQNWSLMTPTANMAMKTPASLRSWGSQQNLQGCGAGGGKGFKIPGNKDTIILKGMMEYIHYFLDSVGFQRLPATPAELKSSTVLFHQMMVFVGQMMVGKRFFVSNAKEDITTKIVEMATLLRFPSVLSKSHLKSATAQHAWPCCLTFLAWLCARAEAAYAPDPETPLNDLLLNQDQFPEQMAIDSFLRLYHAQRSQLPNEAFNEILEEELEKFNTKVCEQLMGEIPSTLEELIATKAEKMRELEEITSVPDPTKEIRESLEEKKVKIAEVEQRIRTVKEKIALYQNIEAVMAQADSLKLQVQSLQTTVATLQEEISKQTIDKRQADRMSSELNEMRKNSQCLASVIYKLNMDLEERRGLLIELDKKFRETVAQFTAVETFNRNLTKLRVENIMVSANPFAAEELDLWLTNVQKIHEKTEKACYRYIDQMKDDVQRYTTAKESAEKELQGLQRQLDTKKVYVRSETRSLSEQEKLNEDQFNQRKEKIVEIESSIGGKEMELQEQAQKLKEKEKEVTSIYKQLKETEATKSDYEALRVKKHGEFRKAEAEIIEAFAEYVVEVRKIMDKHNKFEREALNVLKEFKAEDPELFAKLMEKKESKENEPPGHDGDDEFEITDDEEEESDGPQKKEDGKATMKNILECDDFAASFALLSL